MLQEHHGLGLQNFPAICYYFSSAPFFQRERKSVCLLSEHFPLYLAGLCSYIRWCILGKSWPQSSSNLLTGRKIKKIN